MNREQHRQNFINAGFEPKDAEVFADACVKAQCKHIGEAQVDIEMIEGKSCAIVSCATCHSILHASVYTPTEDHGVMGWLRKIVDGWVTQYHGMLYQFDGDD